MARVWGGEVYEGPGEGQDRSEKPDTVFEIQSMILDVADAIDGMSDEDKLKWRSYAALRLGLDITSIYVDVLAELGRWKRDDANNWQGDTCPDCGRIKAVGAECFCLGEDDELP